MDYYNRDRQRGYRDYPREEERDRERQPPRKRRHRFDKYRVTGMLVMFFAVSILILGIFDIGWTTSRYGNNCQPDLGDYPHLCSGNHVYVYVGSPLWGGAWLIVVAFLSLGIHPDKERHRRAHRHFLIMLGISLVLVVPAIIVLNVLEVVFGLNIFWMYDTNGSLISNDFLQFGLPIAIVILSGMVLNVILFFCVFMYCCRDDDYEYNKSSQHQRHQESERERDRDYGATEDSYRGRHWSHDPYRNYNRNRGGGGFSGVYGGGGGYGRRYFYN